MDTLVLTGGPCAGKTTAIEVVREQFAGQVLMVPEVATMLLSGFPVPGRDIPWSQEWQDTFQAAVLPVQMQIEEAYVMKARAEGVRLLICDRGVLCGSAYENTGPEEFCKKYGLEYDLMLARYRAVIHMESTATGAPDSYGKHKNPDRFETLERAAELEHATRKAWKDHRRHIMVPCEGGIQKKLDEIIKIVTGFLGDPKSS